MRSRLIAEEGLLFWKIRMQMGKGEVAVQEARQKLGMWALRNTLLPACPSMVR